MATWYVDTTGDGNYDSFIARGGKNDAFIGIASGDSFTEIRRWHDMSETTDSAKYESIARAVLAAGTAHYIGSSEAGASSSGAWSPSHDPTYVSGDPTEYGVEALKKSDFFEADGKTPKHENAILALIKPHKPGVSDTRILAQIRDFMPKLGEVSTEDIGFLEQERGFAEETAESGLEKDIYSLRAKPGEAITPSTGGGMRSNIAKKAAIKTGVETSYDKFGGAMEKAEFAETKGLYGLEEKLAGTFESRIGQWLTGFRQGGRVPNNRPTFSQVLSKLPDAGGS